MNRFEENIKRKMLNFEAEPPQDLWNSIEKKLDNKRSDKVLFYWRNVAAAAAILLVIASASLMLININNTGSELIVAETTATSAENNLSQAENPTGNFPQNLSSDLPVQKKEEIDPINQKAPLQLITQTNQKDYKTPTSSLTTASLLTPIKSLNAGLAESKSPESQILLTQSLPLNADLTNPRTYNFVIDNEKNNISSFTLAAYFAPQQTYRYQSNNVPNPMQSVEGEILSFTSGMMVKYKISNRWEIQSGLGFNRMGQSVKDIASFSHPSNMPLYSNDGAIIGAHPQSMSTSMGGIIFNDQSLYFADISSSRIITLKGSYDNSNVNMLNKSGTGLIQHFEYLELPLSVRYKILDKLLDVSAKAGVAANYLLSSKVYLQGKQFSSPVGESVGVSSFNFSAMGGLVFSYPLTNKMHINIEPTASMFLRPIGQVINLSNETYPYSWSVLMGISYQM
jgi:hypothetical protein